MVSIKQKVAGLLAGLHQRWYYKSVGGSFSIPIDFDPMTIKTINAVRPFTMTQPEALFGLCDAVRYVVRGRIPWAIVECGVWKGGSMMAVAHTLLQEGDWSRDLYLFDTYEGMTPPEERDVTVFNHPAVVMEKKVIKNENTQNLRDGKWCYAPLDEVKNALYSVGYDPVRMHFVKGRVEETIPGRAPESIALLRLDTDWYQSTMHELVHLFPRLSDGAVLIVDDYGFWKGSREAVDEYFAQHRICMLLARIDAGGARMGIYRKP